MHTIELPCRGTDPTDSTEAANNSPAHFPQADAVAGDTEPTREQRRIAQRDERAEAKAAEIRALASLQAISGMGLDNNDDAHHAMFICRSLRADRYPEAIFAHRILSKQAARDMLGSGFADLELVQLVLHLFNYLDGEYSFENGEWIPFHETLARIQPAT